MTDGGRQIGAEQTVEEKGQSYAEQRKARGPAGDLEHQKNAGRTEDEINVRDFIHIHDAVEQIFQLHIEIASDGYGYGA